MKTCPASVTPPARKIVRIATAVNAPSETNHPIIKGGEREDAGSPGGHRLPTDQ